MKENYTATEDDYKKLNSWNFNILEIKNIHEKYKNIWAMFDSLKFFDTFNIEIKQFNEFLVILNEKYSSNKNPFHNFDHGITGFRDFLKKFSIKLFF